MKKQILFYMKLIECCYDIFCVETRLVTATRYVWVYLICRIRAARL